MKRKISLLLAILFILAIIPITSTADASANIVAWNEPAVPMDLGTTKNLSDIAVQFKSDEAPKQGTWKLNGEEVTAFKPENTGVYAFDVSQGSSTKKVYVVVKKPTDTDYVLYSTDFDSQEDLADWTLESGKSTRYSIVDGVFIIDGTGLDLTRATLPAWLGDFGNYCIEAVVMSSNNLNNSRWNSIMYRIQNNNQPYYQMCVRKDAASSSGVEFALRTASGGWDVMSTGSHSENQKDGKFYTYEVQLKNDSVMHSIDGRFAVYNDSKKDLQVGPIAVQANQSKMHIDRITVKLQLGKPEVEIPDTLVKTQATVENISTTITNVAYINSLSDFGTSFDAMSVIIRLEGENIVDADGNILCKLDELGDKMVYENIPIFYINNITTANIMLKYINNNSLIDVAVMSPVESVVEFVREKSNIVRGIIDFSGRYTHKLTWEQIAEVRAIVNSSLAKTAVLDMRVLDKTIVDELQSRLVSVWVYDVISDKGEAAAMIMTGANGVVTDDARIVKASYGMFEVDTITRVPFIIGHRGNPTQAPENSLSSYLIAVQNGADIVETDIYLSKDGEIVIMHDSTIDRTTNGSGSIENMTLEEIKQYYLWGDNDAYKSKFPEEKIPTLRELFEAIKEQSDYAKVFVEIKSGKTEILLPLANLIREMDMVDRVSIISFSATQLKNLQLYLPEVSSGYLLSVGGATATQGLANYELNKLMGSLLQYNTTLNMSYGNLSRELVMASTNRGVTIWPWTFVLSGGKINTSFNDSFYNGVGGLTTNDAQYTKDTIRSLDTVNSLRIAVGAKTSPAVTATTYGRNVSVVTAAAQILMGDDVVSIGTNNEITALKEGTALVAYKLKATLPDGKVYYLYTDAIKVTVCAEEDIGGIAPNTDVIKIEGGLLSGFDADTTVKTLISMLDNGHIKVFKGDTELGENDTIGTGCVVKSYIDDAEIDAKTIVVTGDLDGDGDFDEEDVALMLTAGLTAAQRKASDINKNGWVTSADYLNAIRKH